MFDKSRCIIITSNLVDTGGYSRLGRSFVKNLYNRGYNVRVESIPSPLEIPIEEAEFFFKLGRGPRANLPILDPVVEARNPKAKVPSPTGSIRILNFLPMVNFPLPPKGYRILHSMMESEKINKDFIDRCNRFYEETWTPTEFNKNGFIEAGLKKPCKVLPPGIDPIYKPENAIPNMVFNYKVFGHNAPENPEGKKFISVFRWSYRKGYDLLIKSYLKEFKKSDNVNLIIFSRHASMSHDPKFKEAIEFEISNMYNEFSTPDSPSIYWCSDIIPDELMPSVYSLGDVYVNCSRGEGVSLPTLEANAMEIPAICPNHTAFSDYVTHDNAYTFDVDEWVVCNTVPAWQSGWITREFSGQSFPRFGDGKIEEVGYLMRRAIENPEEGKLKNANMRKIIEDKYNWDKCTDLIEQYLGEIPS